MFEPTYKQIKLMREKVGAAVLALQCSGIVQPLEGMTWQRLRDMEAHRVAIYGLWLFQHQCWRAVPMNFEIQVEGRTAPVNKQELLSGLMIGLAPWHNERVRQEDMRRRT